MWDFFSKRAVKAAKDYRCEECRAPISMGEHHVYAAGRVGGEFVSYRLCAFCDELADAWCQRFGEGEGFPLGGLRQDLAERDIFDPAAFVAASKPNPIPNPL